MKEIVKKPWFLAVAGLGLLVVMVIGSYNGLVSSRETVRTEFGNLQAQYQRRADLIPNLVETVQGAADFEQETLTEVIEARAAATSIQVNPEDLDNAKIAEVQTAQGELSQALGRLLAVSEAYPQLTATQAFRDLSVSLEGTENRINQARASFNEVARPYNTKIQRFPTSVTASIFGFDEFNYFEANEGAQDAPQVDFN